MEALSSFIAKVVSLIIQPLIALLFALALFFFAAGILFFFNIRGTDPKEREHGRRMLIWAVIGLFIMVSAVSILAAVTKTFCGTAFCPTSVSQGLNP